MEQHVTCRQGEITFEYLARAEFGDVATRGHAERAVLKLLTNHPGTASG